MNYRELTRHLRRLGFELERRAKGDHEIWINSSTHARTTIPNWGRRDLKPGTISAIIRDLGISRQELEREIVEAGLRCEVYSVGDCVDVRNYFYAINEGAHTVREKVP